MAVHPDIGSYGNLGNREWKQYALPDDSEAAERAESIIRNDSDRHSAESFQVADLEP